MNAKTKLATIASSFALAVGLTGCGDAHISPEQAYCEFDDSAKYPVRIVDAQENYIIHEGGYKRFEIDEKAGTCTYRHNSGDGFVYSMKP